MGGKHTGCSAPREKIKRRTTTTAAATHALLHPSSSGRAGARPRVQLFALFSYQSIQLKLGVEQVGVTIWALDGNAYSWVGVVDD